jgi:hypothetical protein
MNDNERPNVQNFRLWMTGVLNAIKTFNKIKITFNNKRVKLMKKNLHFF